MSTCTIEGCGKARKARGWCAAHWWRWRHHGDPLGSAYTPTACSIEGCAEVAVSRGWCSRHYQRYRKWGDPTAGYPSPGELSERDRFESKFSKGDGCWEWTAALNHKGYGQFRAGSRDVPAHRYSYALYVGPIPTGMQIDHLCMNRRCVNPRHLRVVTNKQNGEHKGRSSNNTSGFRGVSFAANVGKWVASVRHHGDFYYAGLHETAEAAGRAAKELRNRLYTHNDIDRRSPWSPQGSLDS